MTTPYYTFGKPTVTRGYIKDNYDYVVILDLETTMLGPNMDPGAEYPENKILCGAYQIFQPKYGWGTRITFDTNMLSLTKALTPLLTHNKILLVGHNILFDCKYLLRDYPDFPWSKIDICCTMTDVYEASGQKHKMVSLEDYATMIGAPYSKAIKISKTNPTQDIPLVDLLEYVSQDLDPLYTAVTEGHINTTQNWIWALAEMELNGLHIDTDKLAKAHMVAAKKNIELHDKIQDQMIPSGQYARLTVAQKSKLKCTSARWLSARLFGYPSKIVHSKKESTYFMGCPNRASIILDVYGPKCSLDDNSALSMSEDNLRKIRVHKLLPPDLRQLIDLVLEYRGVNKLLTTYYGKFSTTIKENSKRPYVYPSYNTALVATGRLSSSNPNGQNMPEVVKTLVSSRYGKDGYILDIDFSQLELTGLAMATGDPQLIYDITHSDIPYEIGEGVFHYSGKANETKDLRVTVKSIIYGMTYGGGAPTLSAQTGVDIDVVKKVISAFYARYPTVAQWQRDTYETVTTLMMPTTATIKGEIVHESTLAVQEKDNVETYLHFTELEAPDWVKRNTGMSCNFAPTQVKNYPMQHIAGKRIVMNYLARFYKIIREQYTMEDVKFISTIHDSLTLDCVNHATACLIRSEADYLLGRINVSNTETHGHSIPLMIKSKISHYWG